jgi:hypothetical protein
MFISVSLAPDGLEWPEISSSLSIFSLNSSGMTRSSPHHVPQNPSDPSGLWIATGKRVASDLICPLSGPKLENGKRFRQFFGARARGGSVPAKRLATSSRGEGRSMLATPMAAQAVLDREFLELRAKLLELAAAFDRLDRGGGIANDERRIQSIRQSLKVLLDETGDRAEQIQLIFSRPYDDDWQKEFGLVPPASEPAPVQE